MSMLGKFKDNLIFEAQKEFWNERGRGAKYRLTMMGVPFFKNNFSGNLDDIDMAQAVQWLKDNEFVSDLTYEQDEISFKGKVEGCSMENVKKYFIDHDIEIMGCPIANILMYIIESKTEFSPELLPIKGKEGSCELTLAKMSTSDVVDEV